jgi:hypothetical protein
MLDIQDLQNRFTYHAPPDEQTKDKYAKLRKKGFNLAMMIADFCPDSRERSLAVTKVEEAIMWANASIARMK